MAILVMAVVALVTGGVVDYMSVTNQKQGLQGVADRAALAAAQELVVAHASTDRVSAVAKSFVDANYPKIPHTVAAAIGEDGRAVTVSIKAKSQTYFAGPIARGIKEVHADSTAEVSGGGYVCMIGLDTKATATLNMMNSARLTAEDCAIYSNSRNKSSLWLHDRARVKADLVCVAGGVQGILSAVSPNQPIEDCPPILDPLRDRPEPDVGNLATCDYSATVVPLFKKVKLKPGIYCGGIAVLGGEVTLEPGIYVMKNGLLTVTAGGKLLGENVGFFLTGASSTILFGRSSEISLTAPKTGQMAGLLFFEDRDTTFKTYHQITSDNARNLVGTMYFPKSKLLIDARNPVADRSEYTVIIAREFELRDGPELVLNTDYDATPIPLPDGVGNKAKPVIRLIR